MAGPGMPGPATATESVDGGRLAPGLGSGGSVGGDVDAVGDELHRSIAQGEVASAGVGTVEGAVHVHATATGVGAGVLRVQGIGGIHHAEVVVLAALAGIVRVSTRPHGVGVRGGNAIKRAQPLA